MKKSSKVLLGLFAVVVVIAIFLTGVFVGSNQAFFNSFVNNTVQEDMTLTDGSEITLTQDIRNIKVDWISGNVCFVRADVENIQFIETSDRGISKSDALVYTVRGNTLEIRFAKSSFGVNVSVPSKELIVRLPEGVFDNIEISSVSADVNLDWLYAKELLVETVSANVVCNNGYIDEFDFEGVSGDIEINNAVCPHYDLESVSGEIVLTLPSDSSFIAEFDSVSGDFFTTFDVTASGDEYICANGTDEININTVSGNARVLKGE